MTIKAAKEFDIVNYLAIIHYQPTKISGQQYWYNSPFHSEKTPSFKVNRSINRWFDFSEGKGGNLVDLGIMIHQCSIKDFLTRLEQQTTLPNFSIQAPTSDAKIYSNKIQILSTSAITSQPLIVYLKERNIEQKIAEVYLKEVRYKIDGKTYYALGFKNDSGGYELRNKYFKGSCSPKDVTFIKNCGQQLFVFEGFFNFLSYQILVQNAISLPSDYLILNSASFFQKSMKVMMSYNETHLYLDNDGTGHKYTQYALNANPQKIIDERKLYQGCNDLNEWLIARNTTKTN